MNRRNFMCTVAMASGAAALGIASQTAFAAPYVEGSFEVERSAGAWRKLLGDDAFAVMREGKTERPFSSPLNDEARVGAFICKGCDQPLYASDAKYDSGTGWPSFTAPLDNAVATMPDNSLFARRTEVHCDRCGGHLGHVFDDGPAPTGKRHCLNGLSLKFAPKDT